MLSIVRVVDCRNPRVLKNNPGLIRSNKCLKVNSKLLVFQVTGMLGDFAGQGSTLVCGGAVSTYEDCKIHPGDKKICTKNVECVGTPGSARWCTGQLIVILSHEDL